MVEQRSRIGDWELDTLRASHGKAVVVSMTERRSRLPLLAYSPDGTAENVRNAIVQRLGGLRHTVHILTADNGKESSVARSTVKLCTLPLLIHQ